MTPEKKQLAAYMIEELSRAERKLSTWELDFLESVDGQLKATGSLSLRQLDKLEEIYKAKAA